MSAAAVADNDNDNDDGAEENIQLLYTSRRPTNGIDHIICQTAISLFHKRKSW